MKKIVGIVVDTLIITLFIFSTIFFLRFLVRGKPSFALVYVQSGSMEVSGINIGDIRLICESKKYEVGDIIAFHKDGSIYFHLAIEEVKNGFITQGTSNPAPDAGFARYEDIIGKQISTANFNWFVSPTFRIALISLLYLIVVSFLIKTLYDLLFNEGKLFVGNRFYVILLLMFSISSFLLPVFAQLNNQLLTVQSAEYEAFSNTTYFTFNNNRITDYDDLSGEEVVIIPSHSPNGTLITTIGPGAFGVNSNLRVVIIPSNITQINGLNFIGCYNLEEMVVLAENPICHFSTIGLALQPGCKVYVPDNVVNDYKNAPGWKHYASQIYPLSSRP